MKNKILKTMGLSALCITSALSTSACSLGGLSEEESEKMISVVDQASQFMKDTLEEMKNNNETIKEQNELLQDQIDELKKQNEAVESKIEVSGIKTLYKVGDLLNYNDVLVKYYQDKDSESYKLYKLESSMVSGFDSTTAGTKEMVICFNGDYQIIEYTVLDYNYLLKYLAKNLEKNDNVVYNGMLFDFKNSKAYYEEENYEVIGSIGYEANKKYWLEYDKNSNSIIEYIDSECEGYTTSNKHKYNVNLLSNYTMAEAFMKLYLKKYSSTPYSEMGAKGTVTYTTNYSILDNENIELTIKTEYASNEFANESNTVTYSIKNGQIVAVANSNIYGGDNLSGMIRTNQEFTISNKPDDVTWNTEDFNILSVFLVPVMEKMSTLRYRAYDANLENVTIYDNDEVLYDKVTGEDTDSHTPYSREVWQETENAIKYDYVHDLINDTYSKYMCSDISSDSIDSLLDSEGTIEITFTEKGFVLYMALLEYTSSVTVENGLLTSGSSDEQPYTVDYTNTEVPTRPTNVEWVME